MVRLCRYVHPLLLSCGRESTSLHHGGMLLLATIREGIISGLFRVYHLRLPECIRHQYIFSARDSLLLDARAQVDLMTILALVCLPFPPAILSTVSMHECPWDCLL